MTLKEKFWKLSAETMQTKIRDALDMYVQRYRSSLSSGGDGSRAFAELVKVLKELGFGEADALRRAAVRRKKP